MNNHWASRGLLVFALAGLSLAIGCGDKHEGTYRDPEGAVTLELKDSKASLNFGLIHIDGAYTVDGNNIAIRPLSGDTTQTMVFVVNGDGSLAGPPGSEMPHLDK